MDLFHVTDDVFKIRPPAGFLWSHQFSVRCGGTQGIGKVFWEIPAGSDDLLPSRLKIRELVCT